MAQRAMAIILLEEQVDNLLYYFKLLLSYLKYAYLLTIMEEIMNIMFSIELYILIHNAYYINFYLFLEI